MASGLARHIVVLSLGWVGLGWSVGFVVESILVARHLIALLRGIVLMATTGTSTLQCSSAHMRSALSSRFGSASAL